METLFIFLKVVAAVLVPLSAIPIILHVERRGAAFIQRRVGPNRVGPLGLLQPLADVFKFLFKEEVIPGHVRKYFYLVAPVLALIFSVLPLIGIPLTGPLYFSQESVFYTEALRSSLGIFYVMLATALGPYAILIAGWASNNKFSMLGALRASAQMISYELSVSVALVTMIFVYGEYDFHAMVNYQSQFLFSFLPAWGIFIQPVAALIFLVGMFAECNRLPFDLAEGESELVAGYHVEYSSIKFALFFMAEYMHVIVMSALFTFLFLGGYQLPGLSLASPYLNALTQFLVYMGKVSLVVWFFIWVRWSLPRFRYDQLMNLGWKILLPLGLFNLMVTVVIKYIWF